MLYYLFIYPHIKEEIAKDKLNYLTHHFLIYYKKEPLEEALEKVEPKLNEKDLEKNFAKMRLLYPFPSLEVFFLAIKEDIDYISLKKVIDILFPLDYKKSSYVNDMIFLRIIFTIMNGVLLPFSYQNDLILSLFQSLVGIIYLIIILLLNFSLPFLLKNKKNTSKTNEFYNFFCALCIFLCKDEAFEKAAELTSNQDILKNKEIFLKGNGNQLEEAIKGYSFKEQEMLIYIGNSLKEENELEYLKIEEKNKNELVNLYPYILLILFFLFYTYGVYYL